MNDAPSPAAADHSTGINKSALIIVFLVVFIDLLGFGIVLPMLPIIANLYLDTLLPAQENQILSGIIIGLLLSSFSLMQFLFAPIWGRISDRIGRRPILLLGLAGSVVFYALFGHAAALPAAENAVLALTLFFVARIGAGIAGATIGTAQAVIADSTPPDKRKHGMAIIGAAFGIGFTFGPLIGFASQHFFPDHLEAIGYTAAGLSFVALLLALRMLPETRRFDEGAPAPRRGLNLTAFRVMFSGSKVSPIVLTFFLATLGFAAFEVTLGLLLEELGFSSPSGRSRASDGSTKPGATIFLMFAYVGFVLMFTQGYLYRKLAKKWSEETFMTLGILLMGIGVGSLALVCYLRQESWAIVLPLLFVALTISVIGFAFLTPSAQALVSRRSAADEQGEVLGVNQSAAAMARILGPIFGVSLFKATSDHMLPYIFGGLLVLLMLPLMPRIRRGRETPAPG